MLVVKQSFFPVDLMWDEPGFVRLLSGLSSFSRSIWFDPRGTGSSDGIPHIEGRLAESIAEDMVAVLDELEIERAVVLGLLGQSALFFAATHPERTHALVLVHPSARVRAADDYPEGLSDEVAEQVLAVAQRRWGTGWVITRFAPSMAGDERFVRWCARCERLSVPPEDGFSRLRSTYDLDLRDVLAAVRVPTLVLCRSGSAGAANAHYVADRIAGARLVELPGEDYFVFVGDTTPVLDTVEEFVTGRLPTRPLDRVLVTLMFTDVVSSTEQTAHIGDRRWRELLTAHDAGVPAELERFRGREIKTMGDGFLATFDGPGRAVSCACAIRDTVRALGIDVRVGLHTGEIELRGEDIGGLAVHIAQRVQAHAQPAEVLVSRTVVDLVAGSGIEFADRGFHTLKGVPDEWRLFSVEG